MTGYHTKQKEILLSFIAAHGEEVFTPAELATALAPQGVGKSTVYRLVARMVETGEVRRVSTDGKVAYRYLPRADCEAHLHLLCTDCGRVIHLNEDESARVARRLQEENSFILDRKSTQLLGHCADCAGRRKEV